jgi:hypothetical protein
LFTHGKAMFFPPDRVKRVRFEEVGESLGRMGAGPKHRLLCGTI